MKTKYLDPETYLPLFLVVGVVHFLQHRQHQLTKGIKGDFLRIHINEQCGYIMQMSAVHECATYILHIRSKRIRCLYIHPAIIKTHTTHLQASP